jgi:hypothetical protein
MTNDRNEIVSYLGLLLTLTVSLVFLAQQLSSYGLLG